MEEEEIYIDAAESKIPSKARLKRQRQAYEEVEREDEEHGFIQD